MIEVREATIDDARALAELRWEFRAAKAQPVEDRETFVSRCAGWMRAQLTTSLQWRAWIAEDGATAVGQIWAHTIEKLPNPALERERHVYISNVYVTPAARGGVGSRLLEAVVAWARSQNADRVFLWPTDRSRPMYERHGFATTTNILELKLNG